MRKRPLPTGTVTFLFTDIEGSTALWEHDDAAMRLALAKHDRTIKRLTEQHEGVVFKTVGDASHCAFARAEDAVAMAIAAQRSLARAKWPEPIHELRVRMALHSGTAQVRDGDYFGPTLNRTARLLALAHGRQILASEAASILLRDRLPEHCSLRELGLIHLRDLKVSEHPRQIVARGLPSQFPALAGGVGPIGNLPAPTSSFVGRRDELARVVDLLREHRLVTIAGSGGIGKTRLALEAARSAIDAFPDGIYFVSCASLEANSDDSLVAAAAAAVLGVQEAVGESIVETIARDVGTKALLFVIDNLEHVLAAAARVIKTLAERCPNAHILATSREPLHARGETVARIDALSGTDATALFVDRAGAASGVAVNIDPDVEAICAHVDRNPLSIELAAARAGAFGIRGLRERLADPLRVLVSKDPTEEERHRTLIATIDWSYRLLGDRDRIALGAFSIFRTTFDIDAAVAVGAAAGLDADDVGDAIESLGDKSFLRSADDRYGPLETVRTFVYDHLCESRHLDAVTSGKVCRLAT